MEREKLCHDINVCLSHRRVSGTCVLICLTCVPHAHWVTQLWEPSQKAGRGTYLWVPLTDIDQRDQRVHAPVSHYRDCLLKFYFQKRLISSRVFTHVLIDNTAMSEHLWMHPLQGICYSWYSLASEDTRTRSKLTLFFNYFSKQLIRYSTDSAMYKSKYMYT